MKRKYLLLAILFALGVSTLASERDDLAFLDELYKQKKFSLAIEESKTFLDKYPTSKYSKSIQDRIAKVYFLQGDYTNAIKYFRILLLNDNLKDKERNEVRYYLVRSYAGIGDKKSSEEFLNAIDKKSEYYEKAIYDTGTTYLSKEEYKDAENLFQKIIESKGKYYNDAILSMALLSYNKGEYNRSVAYLNEYSQLKGNKNIVFMEYLMGSAYYKMKQEDLASRYFENAATNRDTVYGRKAILNLIEIYSNKGQIDKVEKNLALLNNKNDYNEGVRILGDSYATKGDYKKAIECYNKVDDLSNPKLLYSYGFSLYKLDKLKDAQMYFESLKNSSYYNQAMYYIFAIDYKLGNYKKILKNREEVKRVVVNQKDTESINLIIANSAYELGEYEMSKDYYSRMYTMNPTKENLYRIIIIDNKIDDIEDIRGRFNEYRNKFGQDKEYKKNIYLSVGELYYRKGMTEEAISVYKEYLNNNSDFDILNNLVVALLAKQDYTEMTKYLDMGEDNLNTRYLKGIAAIGMGKYQDGLDSFKIVEDSPEITSDLKEKISFNKVRAYFLWGKYEEAIKYGVEYLNNYPNGDGRNEILDKTAISYFRLDNYNMSRDMYKKLGEDPSLKEYADFQIADSYYAQGDYTKANEIYLSIFKNYPNGKYAESANYWYLNTLVNLGKYDEFNKEKNSFLNKYPNGNLSDNIYILTAQIYEKKGEKEKSLDSYEQLYKVSTDSKIKEEAALKILDIKLAENKLEEAASYLSGLKNLEIKSYYNSLIYEKQNKENEALEEYKNLFEGQKYKDYAGVKLGTYYYNKKDYIKAREYYEAIDKLENSQYKDFLLYQLSNIDELEGKNETALRGYTKGYILYKGEYSVLSKLKAAQLNEKLGKEKEAEVLYKELYNLGSSFKYRTFVLEKMIYFTLKNGNKVEAKKYYVELDKLDKKTAEKYNQFFN